MSQCTKPDALKVQIAWSHYSKLKIQPMEFSIANGWDACSHTVLKYVTRHQDKNGRQDLEKALHCADMRLALLPCGARPVAEVIEIQDYILANAVPPEEAAALTSLSRVVWENSTRSYLELKAAIQHLITVRYGAA